MIYKVKFYYPGKTEQVWYKGNELVSLWTSMPDPEVKEIADELEMSRTKVRKLLITAGVRDGVQYYS